MQKIRAVFCFEWLKCGTTCDKSWEYWNVLSNIGWVIIEVYIRYVGVQSGARRKFFWAIWGE